MTSWPIGVEPGYDAWLESPFQDTIATRQEERLLDEVEERALDMTLAELFDVTSDRQAWRALQWLVVAHNDECSESPPADHKVWGLTLGELGDEGPVGRACSQIIEAMGEEALEEAAIEGARY